jgi:hypothetical protein
MIFDITGIFIETKPVAARNGTWQVNNQCRGIRRLLHHRVGTVFGPFPFEEQNIATGSVLADTEKELT